MELTLLFHTKIPGDSHLVSPSHFRLRSKSWLTPSPVEASLFCAEILCSLNTLGRQLLVLIVILIHLRTHASQRPRDVSLLQNNFSVNRPWRPGQYSHFSCGASLLFFGYAKHTLAFAPLSPCPGSCSPDLRGYSSPPSSLCSDTPFSVRLP